MLKTSFTVENMIRTIDKVTTRGHRPIPALRRRRRAMVMRRRYPCTGREPRNRSRPAHVSSPRCTTARDAVLLRSPRTRQRSPSSIAAICKSINDGDIATLAA